MFKDGLFIPGSKWSKLTISHDDPKVVCYKSGRKYIKLRCMCDCGNDVWVKKHDLKSGHTKSCGCYRREKMQLSKGEAGFRYLLYSYKQSAKIRNIEFNLSIDQFRAITNSNCYYCGVAPSQSTISAANGHKDHSNYIHNGIDRLDNNVGYIADNCVAACSICNIAKKDMSYQDFINWIKRVYEFQVEVVSV